MHPKMFVWSRYPSPSYNRTSDWNYNLDARNVFFMTALPPALPPALQNVKTIQIKKTSLDSRHNTPHTIIAKIMHLQRPRDCQAGGGEGEQMSAAQQTWSLLKMLIVETI